MREEIGWVGGGDEVGVGGGGGRDRVAVRGIEEAIASILYLSYVV